MERQRAWFHNSILQHRKEIAPPVQERSTVFGIRFYQESQHNTMSSTNGAVAYQRRSIVLDKVRSRRRQQRAQGSSPPPGLSAASSSSSSSTNEKSDDSQGLVSIHKMTISSSSSHSSSSSKKQFQSPASSSSPQPTTPSKARTSSSSSTSSPSPEELMPKGENVWPTSHEQDGGPNKFNGEDQIQDEHHKQLNNQDDMIALDDFQSPPHDDTKTTHVQKTYPSGGGISSPKGADDPTLATATSTPSSSWSPSSHDRNDDSQSSYPTMENCNTMTTHEYDMHTASTPRYVDFNDDLNTTATSTTSQDEEEEHTFRTIRSKLSFRKENHNEGGGGGEAAIETSLEEDDETDVFSFQSHPSRILGYGEEALETNFTFTDDEVDYGDDDDDLHTYTTADYTVATDNKSKSQRRGRAGRRHRHSSPSRGRSDHRHLPTDREFAGATVAGAVAGLLLGGPIGAIAVGASSAYVVTTSSPAGNIVRKGGESVSKLGDKVFFRDKKKAEGDNDEEDETDHDSKNGNSTRFLRNSEKAMKHAKLYWKKYQINTGQKIKYMNTKTKDQIRQVAFCGCILPTEGGDHDNDNAVFSPSNTGDGREGENE